MRRLVQTFVGALVAILASGLVACTSTSSYRHAAYNPTTKFAPMAPARPMEITGSRIKREVSPDDPSPPTLAKTTVITREAIDVTGETNLYRVLRRYAPNLVRRSYRRD